MGILLVACSSVAACADILGIDDGIPREFDASIVDSASDTTTLPDAPVVDVAIDVPVDVPVSPLACGTAKCNAVNQACCRTGNPSQADAESFACVNSPSECDGGLVVVCDEPANCAAQGHPGTVCCGVLPDSGGTIATTTACVAPGACNGVLLCEPGDDEMCKLDAGQGCYPSSATILGWLICK